MSTRGPVTRGRLGHAWKIRSHPRRPGTDRHHAGAANVEALEKRVLLASAPTAAINGGGNSNRSGIRELTFSFSDAVTIDGAAALRLFDHTTGLPVDLSNATLVGNGTASVTWDLSGVALDDGRYSAELPADAATPGLTSTHAFAFHKLAGDANGDGAVSNSDYREVNGHFGSITGGAFRPGDANGDGVVSNSDYREVNGRFGTVLATLSLDFGDAPDSAAFPTTLADDGARHVLTGNDLFLGASRDAETDGLSSATAGGDDAAGVDDENGLTIGDLERGSTVSVTVTANVPAGAVLNGWIDWNADGDWDDAGEQVFANVPLSSGPHDLDIDVPAAATPGPTTARFRLTQTPGYSYFGLAPNGEVEDYQVTVTAPPQASQIVLGPSDNIALDQPRVTVLLTEDEAGEQQVGPFIFNTFLLDTGSNAILAMASAVSEMDDPPHVYQTEGEFIEQGAAGPSLFDISAPYYFHFAASGNGYVPEPPLPETRILSNSLVDFSIFGPYGIAGMPTMDGRVTSLDFSVWSGGLDDDLENIYMGTTFSESLPPGQNRYSIAVDNRISFDPEAGILSGEHPPSYVDIPFLTATISNDGVDHTGNLVLDTGAQVGILSSEVGFELHLDSNGDGVLDPLDENYVDTFVIGGVGGEIQAHMFFIEEVRVPTEQGVELVWTDLGWLILDIEAPPGQPTIDGVFGSDLLTSGWVNAIFMDPPGPDGYIQQAHFDFRNWSQTGNGTLYLDLTTTASASATGEAFAPRVSSDTTDRFSDRRSLAAGLGDDLIPGTALHRALSAARPDQPGQAALRIGSAASDFVILNSAIGSQRPPASFADANLITLPVEQSREDFSTSARRDMSQGGWQMIGPPNGFVDQARSLILAIVGNGDLPDAGEHMAESSQSAGRTDDQPSSASFSLYSSIDGDRILASMPSSVLTDRQ